MPKTGFMVITLENGEKLFEELPIEDIILMQKSTTRLTILNKNALDLLEEQNKDN